MPITPTYPGVYVEEVSSGIRTIAGASTSIAAFIGVAEKGPIGEPVKINNFTEYVNIFGGFNVTSGTYLPVSVYYYFLNGGSECYIVRIALNAASASITLNDRGAPSNPCLTISAKSPGKWGNNIAIKIEDIPEDPNGFILKVVERNTEVDKMVEEFTNCSMNPDSPQFINSMLVFSKYISAEALDSRSVEKGYYTSGEIIESELSNIQNGQKICLSLDGGEFFEIHVTSESETEITLESIRDTIQSEVQNKNNEYNEFTCSILNGHQLKLLSGTYNAKSSVRISKCKDLDLDASAILKLRDNLGGVGTHGSAIGRPLECNQGNYLGTGSDGIDVTDLNINDFKPLDSIDDTSLIAAPGWQIFDDGRSYCRNRPLKDCFFIGDIENGTDLTSISSIQAEYGKYDKNNYGAVYGPWINVNDPAFPREKREITIPPSGFIAALYGKVDTARGVWKAPAGTLVTLSGAIGLAANINDKQQGDLNNKHINIIRKFPSYGFIVWGARTMTSPDDTEWKYIPVRRMAIFLRVSIYRGIQWAVFEPNDAPLWSSLRLCITSFMTDLFRKGAFAGKSPSEAFFVKCDCETTTQNDINLGIVNVLVGFAPLRPAEFVMVKLSQKAGGN